MMMKFCETGCKLIGPLHHFPSTRSSASRHRTTAAVSAGRSPLQTAKVAPDPDAAVLEAEAAAAAPAGSTVFRTSSACKHKPPALAARGAPSGSGGPANGGAGSGSSAQCGSGTLDSGGSKPGPGAAGGSGLTPTAAADSQEGAAASSGAMTPAGAAAAEGEQPLTPEVLKPIARLPEARSPPSAVKREKEEASRNALEIQRHTSLQALQLVRWDAEAPLR